MPVMKLLPRNIPTGSFSPIVKVNCNLKKKKKIKKIKKIVWAQDAICLENEPLPKSCNVVKFSQQAVPPLDFWP